MVHLEQLRILLTVGILEEYRMRMYRVLPAMEAGMVVQKQVLDAPVIINTAPAVLKVQAVLVL